MQPSIREIILCLQWNVWIGNAKDVEDAYVLVFGTGIGGAMVKDRRIHRGKHLLAGEVSYIFEKIDRGDLDRIQQGEKLSVYEAIEKMPFTWSAIDLVSTHEGVVKRYGFIYVNRDEFDLKDLKRYRKDSFYWYKKVIATNGEDLSN